MQRGSKLKVIWAKERLQDLYNSNPTSTTLHGRPSGDASLPPVRCCRLCGADRGLRRIGDSFVWEGVEERYDQLLADCFGVRVSPTDGMICDRCVLQLRNTQKFRSLVHAAFEKTCSECTSFRTTADICSRGMKSCSERTEQDQVLGPVKEMIKNNDGDKTDFSKKILELLTKKVLVSTPKKPSLKKRSFSNNIVDLVSKRTIVLCSVCGQRYPMISSTSNSKIFICSRCKLKKCKERTRFCKKCNVVLHSSSVREHMAMHAKPEVKGKGRLHILPKKPSQQKSVDSALKYSQHKQPGSRKSSAARHQLEVVKSSHDDALECVCSICGKDLKTRHLLDQHLQLHTGEALFECDICKRLFKGKNTLQLHYMNCRK